MSNIKKDNIINQQKTSDVLDEIKNLFIQHEVRVNNNFERLQTNFNKQMEEMKLEVKQLKLTMEQPKVVQYTQKSEPPHLANNAVVGSPFSNNNASNIRPSQPTAPVYNNPFMKENTPKNFAPTSPRASSTLDVTTLNKLLPALKDWPKFSGEEDYDHINFIKYLDHIVKSYNAPEDIILV